MDVPNGQKNRLDSLSASTVLSLFKTMTSEQRRDALLALAENLTKEEAILCQEGFREKIDKGVVKDDMLIHYALICNDLGEFLIDSEAINRMHMRCDDYLGGSDNCQLVFINYKPIDDPSAEEMTCFGTVALHGANIIESPDFNAVYVELSKKLVINKLACVCFKLDTTGIHDLITGIAKKLIHGPFHMNIIRYLIDLCIESNPTYEHSRLSYYDPRVQKIIEMGRDGYIVYRFDIEVDGQKKHVAIVDRPK